MEIWLSDQDKRKTKVLRLYAPESEVILLDFEPLKMSDAPDWNPMPEEWHCYREPLRVYREDYERLLIPFFERLYPTKDAFSGETEEYFDRCFGNWLGRSDWDKFISAVEEKLDSLPDDERNFCAELLKWLKEALKYTDIIVVEGNL